MTTVQGAGAFDVRSTLHDLGFQWRTPVSTPSLDDLCFLVDKSTRDFVGHAVQLDKRFEHGTVLSYDVYKTEVGDVRKAGELSVHWTAVYSPEAKAMVLQAPALVKSFTKESLVTLLDLADLLECEHVYAVIDKDAEELSVFTKAFMYFDFKLVDPRVKKVSKCVLLALSMD